MRIDHPSKRVQSFPTYICGSVEAGRAGSVPACGYVFWLLCFLRARNHASKLAIAAPSLVCLLVLLRSILRSICVPGLVAVRCPPHVELNVSATTILRLASTTGRAASAAHAAAAARGANSSHIRTSTTAVLVNTCTVRTQI